MARALAVLRADLVSIRLALVLGTQRECALRPRPSASQTHPRLLPAGHLMLSC